MVHLRKLSVLVLGCTLLAAQTLPDDPVMKARAERSRAQGIGEGDLPPLPRGIVEPPPLPPPETHVKDTRAGKLAKTRHKTKGTRSSRTSKTSKTPAKGGHKTSRKVKA